MAEKSDITPLMRVYELLKLERKDIYIILLLTVGAGLLGFATPIAVQALVNIVAMGGMTQPLIVVSLILFILLSLSGAFYILEFYVVELIQRRIFVREALQSAQDAQAMQISVADTQNPTELMNRFFDVASLQKSSYQLLTKGLAAVLQAVLGSVLLMFYSFYFALVSLFLLFMAWVVVSVIGRVAVQSAVRESYAKYDLAAWLESIAYNLNIFKFGGGRELAVERGDYLVGDYLQRRRVHFAKLLKQNILAVIVYAIAGSGMLGLGGWLVMHGQINLGQFVAAELVIFGVLSAFLNFVGMLEYLYDMAAAVDKLATIHNLPKERQAGEPLVLQAAPMLACHDVAFAYPGYQQVLKSVSFTVNQGQNVAVLAESGVDRALLADILVGLRYPTSGTVQINGLDLRQLDLDTFRKKTGFINHLEILQGSILDNLRVGNHASLAQVQDVLALLGLADHIKQLPQGLDTPMVPRGLPLSRTEQRLLMVARTILAEPYLIVIDAILDEVDASALALASKALQPAKQPWTLVVLTQSPQVAAQFGATVRLANHEVKGL